MANSKPGQEIMVYFMTFLMAVDDATLNHLMECLKKACTTLPPPAIKACAINPEYRNAYVNTYNDMIFLIEDEIIFRQNNAQQIGSEYEQETVWYVKGDLKNKN